MKVATAKTRNRFESIPYATDFFGFGRAYWLPGADRTE